jgi:hypothetical protein
MRIRRGTLEATRDGRTLYVLLDTDRTGDASHPDSSALISEMRARIEDLRTQLEAERQGHAEARRLLAAALERIPPQLEAPSEPPESPESTGPSETPTDAGGGAQAPTERPQERRGFWSRLFGR